VKLDIKTVITLCTFVATLAGFYYSTQIRLDNLEEEVVQIEKQVKRLTRQLKNK
tara:strand:+ start:587 stop:748 length:162 start_codon:yes stop_codon:yes gene_type:complete